MCDFLPTSVHDILNEVETSLSLPMLIVIALCTVQFAVNHSMHIACNVKEIMRKRSCKRKPQRKCVKEGPGMVERIKGSLCNFDFQIRNYIFHDDTSYCCFPLFLELIYDI